MPLIRRLEGRRPGRGAQVVHIGDGLLHLRPDLAQQSLVLGVPIGLGGQEDELAVAVVLRHRVGAACIDAAGHLAVLEHIGGVPAQIVGRMFGHAQPVQSLGHHRPVADPRAVIAAGARLQDRPLARHQHMSEGGFQRVLDPLGGRRQGQFDPVQLLSPLGGQPRLDRI